VQKAIRNGELVTPTMQAVKEALDDLIAAMQEGTALDRSGRR
jgi:hypothetical protein